MTFGITDAGFARKTTQDIQAELESDFRGEFGQSVRLARTSVFGQLVAVMVGGINGMWELAEACFYVLDPDLAPLRWQDAIGKIRSLARQPDVRTTVDVLAVGAEATVIPESSVVEYLATGERFLVATEAVIGAGGTVAMELVAENPGAIDVPGGAVWEIVTTITGWDDVTNVASPGITGRAVESRAQFATRMKTTRGSSGAATFPAVLARLKNIPGVVGATIIVNDTDEVDAQGRPGGSFEVLASGGSDEDIAAAIWTYKPLAIKPVSTAPSAPELVVVNHIDVNGFTRVIPFTRPETVNPLVEITVTTSEALSDLDRAEIIAGVLAYGDTLELGSDVYPWRVESVAASLELDILNVYARIALVLVPLVNPGIFEVDPGQQARLLEGNITIIEVTP